MKETGDIKHILWPNDLSRCSEAALPQVISLAKRYAASVHVLYVARDLSQHGAWYGDFDQAHVQKIVDWEAKKAAEHQREFCAKHLETCAEYTTTVRIGDPASVILDEITLQGIDLVVMCRKGHTARFDMGGVAQKVVANAPVPVIITPAGE